MAGILVVDDEEYIRHFYSLELGEDGHRIITAAGGEGLLEIIAGQHPDVVVLDIKMTESNGLDLLQEMRNRFYNLPVILCTAYGVYKNDPMPPAADYHVVKSFDLSQLKETIALALETAVGLGGGRQTPLPARDPATV